MKKDMTAERYWEKALDFGKLKALIEKRIHSQIGKLHFGELAPLGKSELIVARQSFISQICSYISAVSRARFDGLEDASKLLERPQVLNFEQLQRIKQICVLSARLTDEWEHLEELEKADILLVGEEIVQLSKLQFITDKFNRIFDNHGNVRESASKKLTGICSHKRSLTSQINSYLEQAYINSDQDFVAYQDGRILLLASASDRVNGIVHGRSGSKASVYVEPQEIVGQNNSLQDLRSQELREINRILEEFCKEIFDLRFEILSNQNILAKLDFYFGLGEFSIELGCRAVEIAEQPILDFKNAYHPLLKMDLGQKCIPFCAEIGQENCSYLVVSGANAGGKTIFLKSVGLLALMVNCGLLIPADSDSKVGVFRKFFVGIGDMQSLDNQLSSFSGYMLNLKKTLQYSGAGSLVLFDELGSYTDPDQGFALGAASLESLCVNGSVGVITTHLNKLKLFAHNSDNCQNASMSFDSSTHLPTFHLQIGSPADSHALELATNLHFSPSILKRARELLDDESLLFSNLLSELGKEKSSWQLKNEKLSKTLQESEKLMKDYLAKLDYFKRNEKKIHKEQLAKVKSHFENLQKEFSLKLAEAKKNNRFDKLVDKSADIVRRLQEQEFSEERSLSEVQVGDVVFVKSFADNGKVVSVDGEQIKVEIGRLLVSCKLPELYLARGKKRENAPQRQRVILSQAKRELNLLGKTFLEAQAEIDNFIDDALLSGLEFVRIVHGKGVLAGKVRDYLHSKKIEYTVPEEKFGGDGVSEVNL